jgi:hypothetical protein
MTGSRALGLPFRHHPEPGEHDHTKPDEQPPRLRRGSPVRPQPSQSIDKPLIPVA